MYFLFSLDCPVVEQRAMSFKPQKLASFSEYLGKSLNISYIYRVYQNEANSLKNNSELKSMRY